MPEKIRGGGELFKYQWTLFSRVQQAPLKYYWKHGRMFRYSSYSILALSPLFWWFQKQTNSPPNVKEWEEIRAHRKHTFFELPKV